MDLSLRNLRKNIAAFSVVALLASLLAVNVAFAAASDVYGDVDGSEWYAPYVDWGLDNGVLDDTQAYFRAGDNASRAEFFKMTAAGAGVAEGTCDETLFPDLDASHWACGWITGMAEAGIISGDGSASATPDHVRPNDNITRAEAAKVAVETFGLVGDGTMGAEYFTDVPADAWYNEYMGIAAYNCVFQGDNGAVSPGNDIVRAEAMAVESRSATPETDCTIEVIEAGALTVAVDGSTPAGVDVPKNGSNILYTVFELAASSDEALRVEELILTREGLGLPGDFTSVKLYVDGVQMGSQKTVNTSTNTATFSLAGDPIVVPAGSMVLVEVRADMAGQDNSQNTFCINSADDVLVYGESSNSQASVGGSFQACGEYMTTTSASVGALVYEYDDYAGEINIGETNISAAKVKLTADSVEDIDVTRITFKQKGSADPVDFANMALYISGSQIADNPTWDGDFLTFDLSVDPIYIARGNSKNVELRTDVVGGLGSNMLFEIYRDWHIEGTGTVYHYGVNVTGAAAGTYSNTAREIVGGNLAFAISASNPTVGDMLGDAEDHNFLEFNVSTAGDGVTLNSFDIEIAYAGATVDSLEVQDVKVWAKNSADEWVVIAGPLDPATGLASPVTLSYTDTWDLAANTTSPFRITMDGNSAPDAAEYTVTFKAGTVDAEYSDGTSVNAADISGGDLIGNAQTVSVPTLSMNVASAPTDMNVVGGTLDVEPINWDLTASSAADVLITSLTVTCDYTDTTGDGDECIDAISNTELFIKDGSTYTSLDVAPVASGDPATLVFNGVHIDIPAGQVVKVALRMNTSKAADDTDTATFGLAATTDISAEYSEDVIVAPQLTIDGGSRVVTFDGAGTLTVDIDADTPLTDNVLDGTSMVEVSRIKFSADDKEDILIQKLRVKNGGADAAVGTLMISDGVTDFTAVLSDPGTGVGEGVFDFTTTPYIVPQNDDLVLTVYVDTNEITTSGAGSGDSINIIVDDLDQPYANFDDAVLANRIDIKAVGASSGTALDGTTTVQGGIGYVADEYSFGLNTFVLRNNIPTFALNENTPGGEGYVGNTAQEVLRFDVAAEGDATMTLESLTFDANGTCGLADINFALYDVNDLGTAIGTSGADAIITGADFTNSVGVQVTTGTSKTLVVKMDTSTCATDETHSVTLDDLLWGDDTTAGTGIGATSIDIVPLVGNGMKY